MRSSDHLLNLALFAGIVSAPLRVVSSGVGPALSLRHVGGPTLKFPEEELQQRMLNSTGTPNSHDVSAFSPHGWHVRRKQNQHVLLMASVLAASLAVALLVLQCYYFLYSKAASTATGRRLGGDDPRGRCERGEEGDDGDRGENGRRHPTGFVSRFGQWLSRLVHRRLSAPRQPEQGDVSDMEAGRLPTRPAQDPGARRPPIHLPPPDAILRLAGGHFANGVGFAASLAVAFTANTALGVLMAVVVAGCLLMALEEAVSGLTGGRVSVMERVIGLLFRPRPPPPHSPSPAGVFARLGSYFIMAGTSSLLAVLVSTSLGAGSAGNTTTSGTRGPPNGIGAPQILLLISSAIQISIGLEELLYAATNGHINLVWSRLLPAAARRQQQRRTAAALHGQGDGPGAPGGAPHGQDQQQQQQRQQQQQQPQQQWPPQQEDQEQGAVGGRAPEGDTPTEGAARGNTSEDGAVGGRAPEGETPTKGAPGEGTTEGGNGGEGGEEISSL
ncbi:hypothetical protein ACSSS7_002115 [Eimeria intestinalis]